MDNEVDFAKYGASLRRGRLIIVGVALVFGLLGAIYGIRSPYQSTFTLQPVERIAELAAAGVPADELDTRTIMEVVAATIASNSGESALRASVDSSVEISAAPSPNPESNAVRVTISADASDNVDQSVAETIDAAASLFEQELGVTVAGVRADAQRRLEASQVRLDAVEVLIATATSEQTLLVDGLIVESQKWKAEIDATTAQIAALNSYEEQLRTDMRALGVDAPEKSPGVLVAAIGGLLAGALLAAAVVLIRTALDRSIRSRRDLTKIGLVNLLGVIPRDADQPDLDLGLASLKRAAATASLDSIQIVPVAAQPDLADMQTAMTNLLITDDSIALRPPLRQSTEATSARATTSLNVVAVRWGRDVTNDVIACANALAAVGAPAVAVLLYDVPRAEVSHIEG